MACITEAIGMSLPYCATTHAVANKKILLARESGEKILELVKKDITPSKIMTQKAFENAVAVDLALGGSTNTTLHVPAIAYELLDKGIVVNLDLFDDLSRKIPHITSIRPSGVHSMLDLDNAGGIPGVLKALESKLAMDVLTCTSKSLKENIKDSKILDESVIRLSL